MQPADQTTRQSGTLTLGHIDVNSLAGKTDLMNVFLYDHNIDILCLSETKLTGAEKRTKIDPLIFSGYVFHGKDRAAHKRGRTVVRGGGGGILCAFLQITTELRRGVFYFRLRALHLWYFFARQWEEHSLSMTVDIFSASFACGGECS